MKRPKFSKREPSNITVKVLQEKYPDLVCGVETYNKYKVAVLIPNGRVVIDSRIS